MAETHDTYGKKILISLKLDGESLKKAVANLGTSFTNELKSVVSDFTSQLKFGLKDVIDELNNILSFSRLSNAKTRELAFGYGFSASESYGWSKALKALGFSGEEDLFYANTQELRMFRESFEKYSKEYEELYDSGFFDTMQEFEYEMREFKQQMILEVAQFFMNNKDLIKDGMIALMEIGKWVLDIASKINKLFGGSTTSNADILNQYSTVNHSNTNVNINNTYNNADRNTISNAGEYNYQQLIVALGGR